MSDKDYTENCEQTKPVGVERALGTCSNFWCNEYNCEGKYYDTCRDYAQQPRLTH